MPIIPANWDDYDSDLTSLVSDDDELKDERPPLPLPAPAPSRPKINTRPSTKEATAKSQKKARTNPHLAPPRICQYSAHQLHKMLGEGRINLDPEYQRDVVWSPAKQTALIDSLIHNYYMPPIIFSVTYRSGDIPGKMVCIDGKQRLTSIKRFMDGEIPHKDTFSGRKSYFINGPEQRRKLLTKPELQEFENQQIACVEYLNLTDEDEREIFQRVQMGVALTPAERMNAINAPYATLARELQAKRQMFDRNLKFQDTQKREYLAILQIIVMITGGSSKVMEPKNQKVENFLAKKDPVATTVRNATTIAINIFCLLIEDPVLGRPLCNSKHRLVPIEYVMTIYLIHLHHSKLSLTQLSDAVDRMREHLRSNFKEPQFSTAFKLLLTFVTKGVAKTTLKSDCRGDAPADPLSIAAQLEAAIASRTSEEVITPLSSKRKRAECKDDGDDSDDDRPLARRRPRPGRPRKVVLNSDDEAIVKSAPPHKAKTTASRASVAKAVSANAVASSSKATTTVKRVVSTNTKTVAPISRADNGASGIAPQTATPTIKPSAFNRTKKSVDSVTPSLTLPVSRSTPQIRTLPTPPASSASSASFLNPILSQTISLSSQINSQHTPSNDTVIDPLTQAHSSGRSVKSEPRNSPLPSSVTFAKGGPTSTDPSDRLAPIRAAKQRLLGSQHPAVSSPYAPATRDPRRPQQTQSTPPLVITPGNIDPYDRLTIDCDNLLEGLPSISRARPIRASTSRPPSPHKVSLGSTSGGADHPSESAQDQSWVPHGPESHAKTPRNVPLNVSNDVDNFGSSAYSFVASPIPFADQSADSHRPLRQLPSGDPHSTQQYPLGLGLHQLVDVSQTEMRPCERRPSTDSRFSSDGGRQRHRGLSRDKSTTGSSAHSRHSRSRSPRPPHGLPRSTPPLLSSARRDSDRQWDPRGRNRYYDSMSRWSADNRGGRGREVG
ncbi:hypothetical protein BDZ94DRAFT_1250713 [Collybia nuda]|uniref:GmrSD restriction endonucleases N-terminal domain-containing protein n=1 Tax=Collybia nuda TaxID=64659 RepID=A0A9P5YFM3_9AGAR|nr:hypothetical protein BDZ94DRAFT_1250713 [Collybia nuda]